MQTTGRILEREHNERNKKNSTVQVLISGAAVEAGLGALLQPSWRDGERGQREMRSQGCVTRVFKVGERFARMQV